MDTLDVRTLLRFVMLLALAGPIAEPAQAQEPAIQRAGWSAAAREAARMAPAARIVVLDAATGQLLAASHLSEAARTLATPGSTLKPLVLYSLVAAGRWDPAQRIACTGKLRVGSHSLNCSHPLFPPMDARAALTWSCNSYFAHLAGTLLPGELQRILAQSGLLNSTGIVARGEAVAGFRAPRTPDENRLELLGVEGIRVTPLELASAYRWLAAQSAAHPEGIAAQVVAAGLADSASFGMAGAAALGGVAVAGKTGTAGETNGDQTHGWFAGLAPAAAPRVVIVVYLPAGRGADAARVAAELLTHSPLAAGKP